MNRKFFALFLSVFISLFCYAQNTKTNIAIIPEPVSVAEGSGVFIFPDKISIEASDQNALQQSLNVLKDRLGVRSGSMISVNNTSPAINLVLNKTNNSTLGDEGYTLSVSAQGVVIKANTPAGIFYGVQTLLQLFPKEIESVETIHTASWKIPYVEITDYPRFKWRGLMLDVSRHFFTKEDVKKYIDAMVKYKFNIFHWHLADDQGWRVEIKSLPKLTEVGAWCVKREGGYMGAQEAPRAGEPKTYGGFYTQEDIKEIVRYAKERFVNILPEIDVPGHSLAAIVAYPELSCTAAAVNYHVSSGEEVADWSVSPPVALVDNTLNPANEKVYNFLDKVFTEIAQLFPFEYIHVGGDECMKNFWEKSDAVKDLMKKEGLKNMNEVQSYFEKRLEKIVEAKGKKFIGWDEILEGGLAPNAAVMSWRGMEGGIAAAKMGHQVVMSPTTYTYIDYMQGDPAIENRVYAGLRLNKTYQFEPVPDGVDPKFILGGQANLWTEQVYNLRYAEYMTWPRAMSISETLWSPKEKKNWEKFSVKVQEHFPRFDMAEINYAPSMYEPDIHVSLTADSLIKIHLQTEITGIDIYYSVDNS
ncbi:MAG: beta-N-acetylhexosaminidase, partial [Chitinophagaceae bacterium]|nr:beta-N-acetylhexosaminidase [Chitinophagaceae bacterium]